MRGGATTPERALEYMREDVEFDASTQARTARSGTAARASAKRSSEWLEIWDEFRLEFEQLIDAGREPSRLALA